MTIRSALYRLAKLLGDYNAIRRGRVKKRVTRRIVGRLLSGLIPR